MDTSDFYREIYESDKNSGNMAVTVIDGAYFGEKALFCERDHLWQAVWPKTPGRWADLSAAQLAGISKAKKTGIYEIDGNRVFCEFLSGEKKIVICGGGHVSIPMIRIGRMLGCPVTVLEDRPKFADHAKNAGACTVICKPFAEGLAQISGDKDTFFVVVTRGHCYDQICLESITKKKHAYIGLMGSRKRTAIVKQMLLESGCQPEIVNSIHTPIGLDIGARTPEEIAVAVMAEIIQVKNRMPDGVFPQEILNALLNEKDRQQPKVLATIIGRSGSAPREVGTKMLIQPDGSCIGTIGGGCAEARIQERALIFMQAEENQAEIFHVDMTGTEAQEEGMVCGGTIDVLLEAVRAV